MCNVWEGKGSIVDGVGKIREVSGNNENVEEYNRKYGLWGKYVGSCVYGRGGIMVGVGGNFMLGMGYGRVLFMGLGVEILLGIIDYGCQKCKGYDQGRGMYKGYISGGEYEGE